MDSNSLRLAGMTALITGASRGIGRAIAIRLAQSGVSVLVHYHTNAPAAAEVVSAIESQGGIARSIQADVAKKGDIERLFKCVKSHFGDHLDILVNNAGGPTSRAPLETMTEAEWDRCLAVNAKGPFLCIQAAWPLLPDKVGRIVNVTSISANTGGGPGMMHYAAAKAALSSLTRSSAKVFAPRGITVNAVAPGIIDTDIHRQGTPQTELDGAIAQIPLGRMGQANEIAEVAAFLCSEGASYLTGQIIEVNGGMRFS